MCKASTALFSNPEGTTLAGLLRHIKGPDFAGGGQVINSRDELEALYAEGRGMLTVRARYEVRQDLGGWHLVFTELPPRVSPEQVLTELDALSNPQPKKPARRATAAGRAHRGAAGGQAGDARPGERDQQRRRQRHRARVPGGVPPFAPPETRRARDYLFGVTSLESRVKVNMNLIDLSGRPRQMWLLDVLRDWNRFRLDTVTRRSEHRLSKVEDRIHILEGFTKILLDIDEVIRLIRRSENDRRRRRPSWSAGPSPGSRRTRSST